MRNIVFVLPFVFLALLSWGLYGPVLHAGQHAMGDGLHPSSLRPLICVGIAYFVIAVLVPLAVLWTKGERGRWSLGGTFWSLLAGVAGAVGALGIILAFKFGGSPVYVMPLVFGAAPVVNTFVTMWMTNTFKQAAAIFFAGVILVAAGGAGVLFFKPAAQPHAPAKTQADAEKPAPVAAPAPRATTPPWYLRVLFIPLAILMTGLSWGSYGPVLHKGQMNMDGSRLRPFLCVGVAYFAIAVLAPIPLLRAFQEAGGWNVSGVLWSLGGGAAGAVGALGIILAFNSGGKPIYVMPLVFGGAPVVNTLTTIAAQGSMGDVSPLFYGSLIAVIAGAVTVLVFAPRPAKHAAPTTDENTEPELSVTRASPAAVQAPVASPTAAPSEPDAPLPANPESDEKVKLSFGSPAPGEIDEDTLGFEDTMDPRFR
jgi:hypothetical protein